MKKNVLSGRRVSPAPADHAAAGDLLRVLCALFIGWYHIWQQSWLTPTLHIGGFTLDVYPLVRSGYLFVDLLLLLSGFVLYLPYANDHPSPATAFYRRRALRILPSYWFCLAVMLVFALTEPGFSDGAGLAKDMALHLTFTHNLFPVSYAYTRLNAVLWTLAVEVQFYLLLPALAPTFRRHPIACYLVMTGAALSFRNLWTSPMEDTTLFINRLPNMLDVYANGMLAAHLYARLARCRSRRALIAALATVACALGAWGVLRLIDSQFYVSGYENIHHCQLDKRWPLSACGAVFLLGGSLSFAPIRKLCSNRPVRMLSALSFNFYIWHQWLAVRLKQWRIPPYLAPENPNQVGEMPWQLQYTLLCFAVAMAFAALLYFLVERPVARWGRRRFERGADSDQARRSPS